MAYKLHVALVTGSTSNIGHAIVQWLSLDGDAVVVHSRSSAQAGAAIAAELRVPDRLRCPQ